jgi:hypothetical protein
MAGAPGKAADQEEVFPLSSGAQTWPVAFLFLPTEHENGAQPPERSQRRQ